MQSRPVLITIPITYSGHRLENILFSLSEFNARARHTSRHITLWITFHWLDVKTQVVLITTKYFCKLKIFLNSKYIQLSICESDATCCCILHLILNMLQAGIIDWQREDMEVLSIGDIGNIRMTNRNLEYDCASIWGPAGVEEKQIRI